MESDIKQVRYVVVEGSDEKAFTAALASVLPEANHQDGLESIADGAWVQADLYFAVAISGAVLQTRTFYVLVKLERTVRPSHI